MALVAFRNFVMALRAHLLCLRTHMRFITFPKNSQATRQFYWLAAGSRMLL